MSRPPIIRASYLRPDEKTVARFWRSVEKIGAIPEHESHLGPCWNWIGRRLTRKSGAPSYGQFSINKVSFLAHRMAWMLECGEIPNGLVVCHRCDNPACVRPDHLMVATQRENLADMRGKGRGYFNRFKAGASHPNAKMTPEQIAEIRALRAAGLSFAKIGVRVGLHASTVFDICAGRTWKSAGEVSP